MITNKLLKYYKKLSKVYDEFGENGLDKLEKTAFTDIENETLKEKPQILREFLNLTNQVVYSNEDKNFEDAMKWHILLKKLQLAITQLFKDENNYNIKILQRVIVAAQVYSGCEVSFYKSLYEICLTCEKDKTKLKDLEDVVKILKFEELFQFMGGIEDVNTVNC